MEPLVGVVAGALTGSGAARTHALVDGRWWLNLLAGILGGFVGRSLWAEALTPRLSDSELAAAAVAGAIGGAVLAVIAGATRTFLRWRARLRVSGNEIVVAHRGGGGPEAPDSADDGADDGANSSAD